MQHPSFINSLLHPFYHSFLPSSFTLVFHFSFSHDRHFFFLFYSFFILSFLHLSPLRSLLFLTSIPFCYSYYSYSLFLLFLTLIPIPYSLHSYSLSPFLLFLIPSVSFLISAISFSLSLSSLNLPPYPLPCFTMFPSVFFFPFSFFFRPFFLAFLHYFFHSFFPSSFRLTFIPFLDVSSPPLFLVHFIPKQTIFLSFLPSF